MLTKQSRILFLESLALIDPKHCLLSSCHNPSGQTLVICPSTSLKPHRLGCFMTLSWTRYSPSQLLYWRFLCGFYPPKFVCLGSDLSTTLPYADFAKDPPSQVQFHHFQLIQLRQCARQLRPWNEMKDSRGSFPSCQKTWTMKSSSSLMGMMFNLLHFMSCAISIAFLLIFNLLSSIFHQSPDICLASFTNSQPSKTPRNRKTSGSSKTWARHGSFNSCNTGRVLHLF